MIPSPCNRLHTETEMTESNERDRRPDKRREVLEGQSLQGAAETPSPSRLSPMSDERLEEIKKHDFSVFLEGMITEGRRPTECERHRHELLAEVGRLSEENMLCREAIEAAEDMYISLSHELDSDSAQGCIRATRRRMQEAIGRAAPKLMLERPEGQKFYGLLWRELRVEKEAAEARLTRLLERLDAVEPVSRDEIYDVAYECLEIDSIVAEAMAEARAE